MASGASQQTKPSNQDEKGISVSHRFAKFLEKYVLCDTHWADLRSFKRNGVLEYQQQVHAIFSRNTESSKRTIYVDFRDIRVFDVELSMEVEAEYYRCAQHQ